MRHDNYPRARLTAQVERVKMPRTERALCATVPDTRNDPNWMSDPPVALSLPFLRYERALLAFVAFCLSLRTTSGRATGCCELKMGAGIVSEGIRNAKTLRYFAF